jgi:hypothetical protein
MSLWPRDRIKWFKNSIISDKQCISGTKEDETGLRRLKAGIKLIY